MSAWRLGSARIKYESMFMFFTELCICVIFIHINEYEIKVVINVFLNVLSDKTLRVQQIELHCILTSVPYTSKHSTKKGHITYTTIHITLISKQFCQITNHKISGFRNPGRYPKKPGGFFGVNPPKKPAKNPPQI